MDIIQIEHEKGFPHRKYQFSAFARLAQHRAIIIIYALDEVSHWTVSLLVNFKIFICNPRGLHVHVQLKRPTIPTRIILFTFSHAYTNQKHRRSGQMPENVSRNHFCLQTARFVTFATSCFCHILWLFCSKFIPF